jgi:hypothetical protein
MHHVTKRPTPELLALDPCCCRLIRLIRDNVVIVIGG